MGEKNQENLERRIEKYKSENQSIKETVATLKEEVAELKRTLRDMEKIFHSLPVGVLLIRNGKILKSNNGFLEQLGYNENEVVGRYFFDFIHRDQREYVKKNSNIWDSGGLAPEVYDASLITRKGESIDCEVRVRRLRFKGRRAVLLILNRLEKRKKEEKEKIQSKKKEALKTMALGLNRELMGYNISFLKKIKALMTKALPEDYDIEETLYALQEPPGIIRDLKLIGGRGDDMNNITIFELNKAVSESVDSVNRVWEKDLEDWNADIVLKTYLRSSGSIKGDPEEMKDVIIHMINNSVESMPDGGEIYITTEDNAGYVHIYIQDNGRGIPARHRDRIFDPFFTSKGNDRPGLGLTLSNAVIERLGGWVEVSSMEGQWTMFDITLPAAEQMQETHPGTDKKRVKDVRMLIIQGEDTAREVFTYLLSIRGCKVDSADNSLEGLGRIKKQRYDLVIADIDVFKSDEESLVKKFGKMNPKMFIAFIKKDEEKKGESKVVESGADLIIKKPLNMDLVVKQVLDLLLKKA